MKDISVSFATTGVVQAVNIATGILAARLLLPEGRGALLEVMLWPGLIAELGIIGLSDALLYRAATRAASPRELFGACLRLMAVLTAILVAIGWVLIPLLMSQDDPALVQVALVYLSAYLPIYFAALFIATLFQGHLDMMTWNVVRVIVPLGYLAGILVATAFGAGTVSGFLIANVAGHVLSVAAGLWFASVRGWIGWRARYETMRDLVVYGAKVHVGEVLNTIRQRLDQALVALWLSHDELGLYAVALTIANGPLILIYTVGNVAFPKISQQTTQGGREAVFGRYLRFSIATALACVAGLVVLSPWLVPLLFGRPFAPAVPVTQILLLGMIPLSAKLMFMQALKAWDRALAISRAELVGLVVGAASLWLLLPRLGIAGAAWSLVIAHLVAAAAMALMMRRDLGIHLGALLRPTAGDLDQAMGLLRRRRR